MKATIESVEIISGENAGKGWKRPMQKVTTSEGVFIDNDINFRGPFWKAPDYSALISQEVEFTPVNDYNKEMKAGPRGYFQWIRLSDGV